jgi:hypothetical protein
MDLSAGRKLKEVYMAPEVKKFKRIALALALILFLFTMSAISYYNSRIEPERNAGQLVINALILALPLSLLSGGAYVLAVGWYEHRVTGTVSPRLARVLHWAPRIGAMVIIFFTALFSLDVFEMSGSPLELLGAFVIHSTPSILMIAILVLAWRRAVIGFLGFFLAGLGFIWLVFPEINMGTLFLFCAPLWMVSGLFFADWRSRLPLPPARQAA